MHVHDSWYTDVPDTFALLPRNTSDAYFLMEPLLDDYAFCLGGPNFDPHTAEVLVRIIAAVISVKLITD
jgi:hypothetical protein